MIVICLFNQSKKKDFCNFRDNGVFFLKAVPLILVKRGSLLFSEDNNSVP